MLVFVGGVDEGRSVVEGSGAHNGSRRAHQRSNVERGSFPVPPARSSIPSLPLQDAEAGKPIPALFTWRKPIPILCVSN